MDAGGESNPMERKVRIFLEVVLWVEIFMFLMLGVFMACLPVT